MQALFTEGALVDVRAEERTGRRNSVGGRAWVKKVGPGTPTTAPSYSVSPQTKAVANHEAQRLQKRGPFLVNEIYNVLSITNGSITWRQLTTQVAGGE
jgi:hypothetical protein